MPVFENPSRMSLEEAKEYLRNLPSGALSHCSQWRRVVFHSRAHGFFRIRKAEGSFLRYRRCGRGQNDDQTR